MKRLVVVALFVALSVPLLALAAAAGPSGWRELRFGMSEAQVQKQILKYRTKPDREWEQTPLTELLKVDLAAKRISKVDLDSKRFHHWMIGHLDDGAATTRAWFDNGKLFAVQAMGTIDLEPYVAKATAAYGAAPERAEFEYVEGTTTRTLPVAIWKGPKATAVIFQPSGWGPELFLISNAGLAAIGKPPTKAGDSAGGATRF